MMNDLLKKALKEFRLNNEFQLRTPKSMSLELTENAELSISILPENKGILKNMQCNASAFESWAICLKSILGDQLKKVIIHWDTPEFENDNQKLHYNRFLYRAIKFEQNYKWTTLQGPKKDLEDFKNELSKKIIIGWPNSEAKESPQQNEAKLEKEKLTELQKKYGENQAGQQLPTGLFQGSISNKTAIVPHMKSQIDLWAISNKSLYIYELKIDSAKTIGIISELMYYTNVMNDLKNHRIEYSPAPKEEDKEYRNVNTIVKAVEQNTISEIIGVFWTENLHPWIACNKEKVLSLLNENTSNIIFEHKKTKG